MLLRGSVFFIGMCLWGSQRVPNLKYSNTTVLPSMLQVRNFFSAVHLLDCFCLYRLFRFFTNAKKRMFQQLTQIEENLQIIIANGLCFDVMAQCVYSRLSLLPPRRGISRVFRTLKGGRGNSFIVYVPRLFPLTTVLLPWK